MIKNTAISVLCILTSKLAVPVHQMRKLQTASSNLIEVLSPKELNTLYCYPFLTSFYYRVAYEVIKCCVHYLSCKQVACHTQIHKYWVRAFACPPFWGNAKKD